MKNTQIGFALVLLLGVMGCGKLGELVKKNNKDVVPDDVKANAEQALRTNFLADPPTPGAIVVRQLARLDPEAASLQKTVEDLERSALKNFVNEIVEKNKLDPPKAFVADVKASAPDGRRPTFALGAAKPAGVLALLQGNSTTGPVGVSPGEINLMVAIVSYLNDLITPVLTEKGGISPTKRQYNGLSYTDMSIEIARGDAGATKFGFKMNTRGINGNRSLDSDLEGSVEGRRCPDATGNVEFTVKVKISGKHADSTYIQEVTAKVDANTNDDADVVSSRMNFTQGIQESVGGRNTYIETEFDMNDAGGSTTISDRRIKRMSQDMGPHPVELANSGFRAALQAGVTGLTLAEGMWKDGGCVVLKANSPGTVEPSSVTEIPVDVKHRYDGSSVPSKVAVELAGETSVSPKQIDQTAGGLTYTAPPEKNKSATIKLEARSNRGRAKLDLNATTGGNAYRISGNLDEASQSGTVCDSSKPFAIGGTLNFKFTPTSPTTGTYTYTGPFQASGSGPYVINGDGTMKLDGTGCIMGGNCATYSHKWKAEPIDPATCKDGN